MSSCLTTTKGTLKKHILNPSSNWSDAPDSACNVTSGSTFVTCSITCLSLSKDRFFDGIGMCFLKSSSSGNVAGGDSCVGRELTAVIVLSSCDEQRTYSNYF
jgi:hypothetical protein